MAQVEINGRIFDIDLIVFDKDGTLIALNHLWGQQIEKWGGLIQKKLGADDAIIHTIYEQMGYELAPKRLLPDTPSAVASVDQFMTIASFLLYRDGHPWTVAEDAVREAALDSILHAPEAHMLQPLGDVNGTFARLKSAGIKLAIATSDDRHPTEKTIEILGWEPYLDVVLCANDAPPMKPAPDGMFYISRETAVPVSRILMVGDSSGDMRFGRAAGVAGCIGIGEGAATAVSDVNIQTIEEILVVG